MVSPVGIFFIVFFVLLIVAAAGWVVFTQLRARRLGVRRKPLAVSLPSGALYISLPSCADPVHPFPSTFLLPLQRPLRISFVQASLLTHRTLLTGSSFRSFRSRPCRHTIHLHAKTAHPTAYQHPHPAESAAGSATRSAASAAAATSALLRVDTSRAAAVSDRSTLMRLGIHA